jgi:hypothetical protein
LKKWDEKERRIETRQGMRDEDNSPIKATLLPFVGPFASGMYADLVVYHETLGRNDARTSKAEAVPNVDPVD